MIKKACLLLFAGVLVMSACAPATLSVPATETAAPTEQPEATATLEPVQLKVGVLNFMSNSPLFIAQEEGYFSEQGLEVELVSFGTSPRDLVPALLQGQVDVGAVAVITSVFSAIAQGSNARYVADKGFLNPDAACAPEALVARTALLEDGTLDNPDGIKGLNISITPGNISDYATDQVLAQAGLTRGDIVEAPLLDQATSVEALRTGSLDLIVITEPWVTRARKAGAADVWIPLSELFPNFSAGSILYGPSMLERDPEVGVRFMVAYLKAVQQYNQGQTDRNVEIIAGFTQLSPEEVREVCWPSFQTDGKIDTDTLMEFQDWAHKRSYIDAVLPIDQIWDPHFVDAAFAILNK